MSNLRDKPNDMKTISVKIRQNDISKYGLVETSTVDFSELVDKITRDFAKQALQNANAIAEITGLSTLSSDEIDKEIQAARNEYRS